MANFENDSVNASINTANSVNPVQATPVQKPELKKDDSITHKVGDGLERIGEKLKDMGAEKLGSAVYEAGDKLEHSDKNSKH